MTFSSSSSSSSPQSPSPPHQYPAAIQLKLYQAFIFSIPILFSIILFLLFYLFYLKRRASSFSSTGPLLPRTINAAPCDLDLKNELKTKLCKILFDESIKAKESTCCVCLGEFEVQEELLQVPSCKHIFHIECIRLWLRSNSTCPLCRAPVISDHTNCKSHHHHLPESQAAPPPPPPEHTHIVRFQGSSSASGGTTC